MLQLVWFFPLDHNLLFCTLFIWLLLYAEVNEASAKLEVAERVHSDFITTPLGSSRNGCHRWPATCANRCVRDLRHPLFAS